MVLGSGLALDLFRNMFEGFWVVHPTSSFRVFFFRIEGRKEGGIALLNSYIYQSIGLKVGVLFLVFVFVIVSMFLFPAFQVHV